MTIDGGFVADEPQSFLLTTAAGTRVFCGGDTSLAGDLRTWGELYRPGPGRRQLARRGGMSLGEHPVRPSRQAPAGDR